MRSGRYVTQATGYKAFIPTPLPPNPAVKMDGTLNQLLSEANIYHVRLGYAHLDCAKAPAVERSQVGQY